MKYSLAQNTWLWALAGNSLVLAQEVLGSSAAGELSPSSSEAVPGVSTAGPGVPSVVPEVSSVGSAPPTASADPGTVDLPPSISTAAPAGPSTVSEANSGSAGEEVVSTPSRTIGTQSSGTASASGSSGTPSATGVDAEFVLVQDRTSLQDSTEQFVPMQLTPEIRAVEEAVNKPFTEVSPEDAKGITVLEGSFFNEFVESAPAPPDVGKITIPVDTKKCEANLGKRVWPFADRPKRCTSVKSLAFDVYYHYMLATINSTVPAGLEKRIAANHQLLLDVYGPLNIAFTKKNVQFYLPGTGRNYTRVNKSGNNLHSWQRQSYQGNKMTLNVWMVHKLVDPKEKDPTISLCGYATFPEDYSTNGKLDGVVMGQAYMDEFVENKDRGSTLVHEIGHWLGLYHTFGQTVDKVADDCKFGDGLLKSTHTRGHRDSVYRCVQKPCGSEESVRIHNWMSYSDCPGGPGRSYGFTTDQKAAMFARVIHFRRGLNKGECDPKDPGGSVSKRSTMQDLVDGKCPDVKAAVQQLTANSKDVVDTSLKPKPGSGNGSGGGSGGGDEDDKAANLKTVSLIALAALVGVTSLFLVM